MGFWQCLPFSWTTLRGKHCWQPIAVMGVVDTVGPLGKKILSRGICKPTFDYENFDGFPNESTTK